MPALQSSLRDDGHSAVTAIWRRSLGAGAKTYTALALVCLIYAAAAFCLWPADYCRLALVYLFQIALYGCVIAAIGLALSGASHVLLGRSAAPRGATLRQQAAGAALTIVAFVVTLSAYTTFKSNIPDMVGFYADDAFAWLGVLIHGHRPWRLAHSFDTRTIAHIVDIAYSQMWFLLWFGLVLCAALTVRERRALHYLWALALTLIIGGTILATLFSSAGPILYDQVYGAVRYGDLADTLRRYPENGNVFRFSGYLLDAYAHGRPTLGGGISAMPSMHVAIATLNAFYLSRINRALGLFGWAFALTILFGSIYTGWHYAVDGYVSILLASAIWLRVGRQLDKAAAGPVRQAWQAA